MSQYPEYKILIVDDENDILQTYPIALRLNGINNVITCNDSRDVMPILKTTNCGIIILDITMPHNDGISLLKSIVSDYPDITVIMLTGCNDAEIAVTCMKMGASDYVVKPIDNIRFVTSIRKAIEHRSLSEESERLRDIFFTQSLKRPEAFRQIIGNSTKIKNIFKYIEAIAPTKLPLLITGETGAGKELFANAVHLASQAPGEFVCVNTAGIDDHLLSDTLFGHKKGSFTGALQDREGLIARAENGTIFLDEIGDLKAESQVKLLRLIQEGTYYKVGSDILEKCNARIVTATNVDIHKAQLNDTFRRDLFYRLKSHRIDIPPLREHLEDIPLLVDYFVEKASSEMIKRKPAIPQELITLLQTHNFPGNIRELKGLVYDAVSRHSSGILSCNSFKNEIFPSLSKKNQKNVINYNPDSIYFPNPLPTSKQVEEALVDEALNRAGGNKTLAAQMLGITRKTLRNKIGRTE
ncbi:MAG: sigma-54 dependent transcriptional regulator [Chitinispirillia bacterium]